MGRVTYSVPDYNRRRYSKPWLAKVVTWPIGFAPTLEFGSNVGTVMAEIEAQAGDLLKRGQKDHRGNGTTNEFCVVEDDGTLRALPDEDARTLWLAREAERGHTNC